jgi:hypothetical protein
MEKCTYCEKLTLMYLDDIPICLDCAQARYRNTLEYKLSTKSEEANSADLSN